jgi:hypothetical protein
LDFANTKLTVERNARSEQVKAATNNLEIIFDLNNISEISVLLLRHFLILQPSDLEAWDESPEEWVVEIAGDVVAADSGLRVDFMCSNLIF